MCASFAPSCGHSPHMHMCSVSLMVASFLLCIWLPFGWWDGRDSSASAHIQILKCCYPLASLLALESTTLKGGKRYHHVVQDSLLWLKGTQYELRVNIEVLLNSIYSSLCSVLQFLSFCFLNGLIFELSQLRVGDKKNVLITKIIKFILYTIALYYNTVATSLFFYNHTIE